MADDADPRFMIEIGLHRFDPKHESAKARRRAHTDRRKLAAALEQPPELRAESELWIVQFDGELDVEAIDRFRHDYGLRLTAGLTSLTFIELMTAPTADRLRRELHVRACIPYWSELKRARSAVAPSSDVASERRLRVGLVELPTAGLEQELVQLGFDPEGGPITYAGGVLLHVQARPGADPEDLFLLSEVEWVEDVRGYVPTNASSSSVAQGGAIGGSNPIWDKGLHGEEQVIGVFDTNVLDMAHDFFRDPAHGVPGPTHRKVLAINSQPGSPIDFHATRVAGCAAGDDVNAPGGHVNRGGAWAAKLVYTDIDPLPATGQLGAALQVSFGQGARVINMSALEGLSDGTKPAPYTADSAAYDHELWRNEYLLMVSAVANTPPCQNLPFLGAPGTAKNPLTVAGTKDVPNQDAFHTGRPGTRDGRRKPDMVAVGENVMSSEPTLQGDTSVLGSSCGTSYAAPHVAAAAALVRQYFKEGWYPTGKKTSNFVTPSSALIKAVLLNATVDLTGVAAYPSAQEGWGRLELDKTLHFDGDKLFLRVEDVPHLFGFDRSVPVTAKTSFLPVPKDAKSMKVTLVFNDPAGAVGANDPVVNQLDLVLLEPMRSRWDGWELGYFGNDFNNNKLTRRRPLQTGTTTFPPDPAELKNNVRQVVIDGPKEGRWGLAVFSHRFDKANTPAEFRRGVKAQGYAWVARVDLN